MGLDKQYSAASQGRRDGSAATNRAWMMDWKIGSSSRRCCRDADTSESQPWPLESRVGEENDDNAGRGSRQNQALDPGVRVRTVVCKVMNERWAWSSSGAAGKARGGRESDRVVVVV